MISKLAHVDPSAKIADGVTIHAFAYIDKNVEIGPGCEIMPYASIIRGTRMGSNNKVYQGAIVGADPQDFRWKGEETYCYIGDNNVIREQVIINRGITSEGGTRIGDDCFIMAESHVGHDTHIKGRCVLGNGVTVAGDAEIGECVILSSNAIVHERCRVGRYALVKGGCRIGSNVPPYVIIAHNPASYYGVNAYVMRRDSRFSEQLVDDAAKAYRHIYQCGTSVYNALKRIEADIDPSELRDDILNFIRENNMRIVGDTHNEY
ncbi:MAG: acyl-ACP--UDP-N-acetylglucosamine O-acyltransferase [Muribaculaceae bacterium]|nr:acyl-ACP--UDP-N-acetylglucosamine O-acyltransferase [Muribaculaceae bacterium]MDE6486131.1 acyl-ACP--UDP-N-acetylglucosamine O-acyltransferase [Muribaculaceae bacterium]